MLIGCGHAAPARAPSCRTHDGPRAGFAQGFREDTLPAGAITISDRMVPDPEPALDESDLPFRDLVDAAPDGVVVADQLGRIVLVNAEAERMFGYARDELR